MAAEDASSEVKVTQAKGAASNAPKIPFTVMARALRRKKMIDAVMEGGEGREEVSRMPGARHRAAALPRGAPL